MGEEKKTNERERYIDNTSDCAIFRREMLLDAEKNSREIHNRHIVIVATHHFYFQPFLYSANLNIQRSQFIAARDNILRFQ